MKFLAEETRDDGDYSVMFDAGDWVSAKAMCKENGWRFCGELAAIVPAGPSFGADHADAMIAAMNDAPKRTH